MAGNRLTWREIRWFLLDALRDRPPTRPPIVKAIPLAFPVVEAVHIIRERVPEAIGLANRYLLEGLCRFGPCNPEDLDVMLGLGTDLVYQTLLDLERTHTGVSHRDRQFTASADAGKLLASGRFTRLVTHPRKFVVNGLTDTLMPVDFWRFHEESRMFPDLDKPSGPMRDGSGNITGVVVKVTDRMGDGMEDLRRHVEHGDTATRERLGIPAGACDLEARVADVACAWVLSFLLVAADRSLEILSAGRHPVSLVEGRFAGRDYLARVCQGLHSSQLEPDVDGGDWRQRLTGWPADTRLRDGRRPGEVLVSVARPDEQLTLRWDNGEEDDADARRLSSALASGLYWDIGHWHLLRLVPGDVATAARVGLLRGVHGLREALRDLDYRPDEKPPLDLAEWWRIWQAGYHRDLPANAVPPALALEPLLREADAVPDTEFLEKLDWLTN